MSHGVTVSLGLAEAHRHDAARLYLDAFGRKLGPILGTGDRAEAFLAKVLNLSQAISATEDGALIGLAGFHDENGGLVGGGFRDLVAVYGWPGAAWRTPALALFEREPKPDQLLMDGVVVAQAARGRGVGARLLDAVEAHATALGRSAIRLDVVDTNPRARALYVRKGFDPVGKQRMGPLAPIFGFSYSETMVKAI